MNKSSQGLLAAAANPWMQEVSAATISSAPARIQAHWCPSGSWSLWWRLTCSELPRRRLGFAEGFNVALGFSPASFFERGAFVFPNSLW